MADPVVNRSVTKGDYQDVAYPGIWHFMMPAGGNLYVYADLPPYGSQARDFALTQTLLMSTMWASAVGIAITKMASQDWLIDSDIPLRSKKFQELLLAIDNNKGWVPFLSKHLSNYLLTNNGAFIEIIREGKSPTSRIIGLKHLDSLRCIRTGNLEEPVVYQDRRGAYHKLKDHQVFCLSDMPDASETYYGIGHCAAERAWDAIRRVSAVELFMREKITGKRALSLYFINGVKDTQITTAIEQSKRDSESKGLVVYMGAAIIPIVDPEAKPVVGEIPLASLPDGFDRKQELDIALLEFANALGLDPQDLEPLTGQSLGSGAQSVVLAEKAQGKGLVAWRKSWVHSINEFVLPDATSFTWQENDLRDKQSQANIFSTVAAAIASLVTTQVINPLEAKQVLVDKELIDKAFIAEDVTPDDTLSDEEKPDTTTVPDGPVVPNSGRMNPVRVGLAAAGIELPGVVSTPDVISAGLNATKPKKEFPIKGYHQAAKEVAPFNPGTLTRSIPSHQAIANMVRQGVATARGLMIQARRVGNNG